MRVIAFVGPSGSGKSYRSIMVSQRYGADAIIDDGLLISHGKVLAGTSAKREPTKLASVRRALYMNKEQTDEVMRAAKKNHLECIMILGTSVGMVDKIAQNIGLPPIEEYIKIEDIATEQEISLAHKIRTSEGKHVIPVPTFEIKQDFSGYFLHPLRRFQKNLDGGAGAAIEDKSIVRPTFSYMGDFTISDNVIIAMALHEAKRIKYVLQVHNINLRKTAHGIHIDMTVTLKYGSRIEDICREIQQSVRRCIEEYTSVNTRRVNILVKALRK